MHKKILAIVLISSLLTNCASKTEAPKPEVSAEQLFKEANAFMESKQYKKAIANYSKISTEHPYSKLSPDAELLEAESYYLSHDYDMAIPIFENFIKLHPAHPDAPQAYYLRAMCYYEQISDVKHDQEMTEKAAEYLHELIIRFKDSSYAKDAKFKLELANDHLAAHEMTVGRFYLKQKELISAINRFKRVVENYQTTSHIEEALYRLVESYLALGIKEEATKYGAVLGFNYPKSKWYEYSYHLLNKK